jgi:hypothetical protein
LGVLKRLKVQNPETGIYEEYDSFYDVEARTEIDLLKGKTANAAPRIGDNGNWYIGDEDTGVKAAGADGEPGKDGQPGADGKDGTPGKSAYEYAQDGGYTGTEEEFAEKLAKGYPNTSVTEYGAKGDGVADDTTAFQTALAENRTVYVPGGTYKLSAGISVGDNCELELAQDAVLEFTQTSGNCITLNMCSSLKGNHATVNVPYAFSGNVLYAYSADTTNEEQIAVPPFTRWSPQWKSGRYVTDLNICKADNRGFHYAVNAGDCCGTAVYLSTNVTSGHLTNMWGVHYSGLRIAGAFEYGIRAVNSNEGWLHEMRVDAFIDACKIGVSLEDCNQAYVSAIIQPRRALNADGKTEVPYATHGIKLVRSKNVDLSGSRVWDWNDTNALWTEGGEYQFLCMYGDCRGAILNAFQYYATSYDIRDLIYTDTPSNLEQITILQEPITRWFKPVDGEPYFTDGFTDKKLTTQDEMEALFGTTVVEKFTNQLPIATDTDGTVYNGTGYLIGANISGSYPPTIDTSDKYPALTGFIPVKDGSTIRTRGIVWDKQHAGYEKIIFYNKNKEGIQNGEFTAFIASSQLATSGLNYIAEYELGDNGLKLVLGSSPLLDEVAYVRMEFFRENIGTNPIITVDEEIEYEQVGILSDGIKVKGENVIGGTSGGGVDVTAEVGQTIVVKEVDASGKPTKRESADYQPRTHYKAVVELFPETELTYDEEGEIFFAPEDFDLVVGNTYEIVCNGTAYTCTAFRVEGDGGAAAVVGNAAALGLDDTGEPFCFFSAEGSLAGLLLDGSTACTLGISGEKTFPIPREYIPKPHAEITVSDDDFNTSNQFRTSYDTTEIVEALINGLPIFVNMTTIGGLRRFPAVATFMYGGTISSFLDIKAMYEGAGVGLDALPIELLLYLPLGASSQYYYIYLNVSD